MQLDVFPMKFLPDSTFDIPFDRKATFSGPPQPTLFGYTSTVTDTDIERLHKQRMLRLRQLQKELTLQNGAFRAWALKPADASFSKKWRILQNLVEQAQARFVEAQDAYVAAVRKKSGTMSR